MKHDPTYIICTCKECKKVRYNIGKKRPVVGVPLFPEEEEETSVRFFRTVKKGKK